MPCLPRRAKSTRLRRTGWVAYETGGRVVRSRRHNRSVLQKLEFDDRMGFTLAALTIVFVVPVLPMALELQ